MGIAKMVQRRIFLLSSSRVDGYGYLEHAKGELVKFLTNCNVKSILFVPYALKDHNQYTTKVKDALQEWGYNLEGLHTKIDPKVAISNADAVFVGGGNTFVLLKSLYDMKLMEVLRDAVLNKGVPYIGSSAGTNIATRSIHTTNDMPVVYPPSFEALNLVPLNINPHYLETDANTKHKGETRDERLNEFVDYHKRAVLGLREGTAIVVYGDQITLVGDRNAKLFLPCKEPIEYKPNSDLSFLLHDIN